MTVPRAQSVRAPTTTLYLAELRMPLQGGRDLSWIGRSLQAASRRLNDAGPSSRVLGTVYSPTDERLSCLLMAASLQDACHLFETALLPPARIVEVVLLEENSRRVLSS